MPSVPTLWHETALDLLPIYKPCSTTLINSVLSTRTSTSKVLVLVRFCCFANGNLKRKICNEIFQSIHCSLPFIWEISITWSCILLNSLPLAAPLYFMKKEAPAYVISENCPGQTLHKTEGKSPEFRSYRLSDSALNPSFHTIHLQN